MSNYAITSLEPASEAFLTEPLRRKLSQALFESAHHVTVQKKQTKLVVYIEQGLLEANRARETCLIPPLSLLCFPANPTSEPSFPFALAQAKGL